MASDDSKAEPKVETTPGAGVAPVANSASNVNLSPSVLPVVAETKSPPEAQEASVVDYDEDLELGEDTEEEVVQIKKLGRTRRPEPCALGVFATEHPARGYMYVNFKGERVYTTGELFPVSEE